MAVIFFISYRFGDECLPNALWYILQRNYDSVPSPVWAMVIFNRRREEDRYPAAL
jgi:hypothetical protein